MRLNPPARSRTPGNRKAPPHVSTVVARHSAYPRARLPLIFARFETYLDQHALSPATIRNYLGDLRAFAQWHAARRTHRHIFTPADFRAYREHLCNETAHSPATVNRRLQSLRLFGRFLHEMGHTAENPTRELKLVRNGNGDHSVPRTLSRGEIARLTEATRAGRPSLSERDHAIMELMLHAGLRGSEVAEIRLNDIVAARRGTSIHVRGNARRGERSVPLNRDAARAVRNYLPTRPAIPRVDHLFLSQRGQPLSMRSIQRLIDQHARTAGLKGVSALSLRNTCTKNMLAQTRDVAQVARWLGCRNNKSLERYGA